MDRVSEQAALLRVQLPLTAAPAGRKDWAWHAMAFTLPPTVAAEAVLCAPTLRLAAHRVCLDLPHRALVPKTSPAGHTVGLGLDWGVNTLLAGALAHLATTPTGTRTVSDGRMLRYDATAISAKLHRLRQVRERVAARLNAYAALLDGWPPPTPRPPEQTSGWQVGPRAGRPRNAHPPLSARLPAACPTGARSPPHLPVASVRRGRNPRAAPVRGRPQVLHAVS
ncbi:hypothetical protein [Planomonospora algeriensis]